MNRSDVVEVLPELVTLVRTPYERLASTHQNRSPPTTAGASTSLPRRLGQQPAAARSQQSDHLSDRLPRPHYGGGDPPSKRATLWLEGGGAADAASRIDRVDRLSGTEAFEALKERMVGQHPEAVHAAPLAGLLQTAASSAPVS